MKTYSAKQVEAAVRLFLQDLYNDQSEIRAESPPGSYIVWGGLYGEEIKKHWLKCKKYLKIPLSKIKFAEEK